jgi:hypothetical protein
VVSASRRGGALHRFDGATLQPLPARVLTGWVDGYGPVIEFPRTAVPADRFDFFLEAQGVVEVDRAPDAGVWSYELRPLQLRARGLVLTPAVAGRRFTGSVRVIASDWDTELEQGRVLCVARLGRTRLRGSGGFRSGRASCSWHLPRHAARRVVAGIVGVSYQGASATSAFRIRVRR